jgi:MFS family permease
MLASGVAAGIIVGVVFGGDWRRLATFSLKLWPILVLAVALRLVGDFVGSDAPLALYLASLFGVAVVAAWNWRVPGTLLIAVGTTMNLLVVGLNSGMPYDPVVAATVGAPLPDDALHVLLRPDTRLQFLSDVIPIGPVHTVLSLGDCLNALGGFLIPFMWLQPAATSVKDRTVRSPNFAFFWAAQVISRFGDPITLVALAYLTYRETNSALWTAIAVLIATIPNAVFGFFGGAVADAVGHRRVMLGADITRAVAIGIVPFLVAVHAPLAAVFAMAFLAATCSAIFNPARGALVPSLLDATHLARGNALVYGTDRAVEVVAGLAAGLLVAALGTNAFLVDAATFALSAMLLSRVVVRETRHPLGFASLLAQSQEGFAILRHSSVLWANTVFSLVAQLSVPVVNGLMPTFLIRRFAENDTGVGAALFGIAEAAIAVGAVAGSVLLPRYATGIRKGQLLVIGFALTGVVVVALALAPSFPVLVALLVVLGIANVAFYVPNVTLMQERTEPEVRARVFGARIALVNLSWLPLIFVTGSLADIAGPSTLIAIAGTITVITALVGLRIPRVSQVV